MSGVGGVFKARGEEKKGGVLGLTSLSVVSVRYWDGSYGHKGVVWLC